VRITQAPLRITLGGGGSDLQPHTGLCLTAAIDKYVTITTSRPLSDGYVLRYSEIERVPAVEQIRHRILRDALGVTKTSPGFELSSVADIPSGTGLGSSGAFTVAVLRALLPDASRARLAALACDLDTGQQDQWSAVYGGVNVFDFRAKTIRPVDTEIDRHLALYWTGVRRRAPEPLGEIPDRQGLDQEIQALEHNDPDRLGWCFQRQWRAKLDRDPSGFHAACADEIGKAIDAGFAHGGKTIGAGGGGFILFATEKHDDLDAFMRLRRVPFAFEHSGVT
jgi:D-glycero-alpha-D-manno-heptose-7-phosphate kinase